MWCEIDLFRNVQQNKLDKPITNTCFQINVVPIQELFAEPALSTLVY